MPKEHAKTNDLNYWLSYINSVHPSKIELGLDRVKAVASEMRLGKIARKIVIVAGTNGKGSCIATMESILSKSGYTVGTYTSPHIKHFSERIKINNEELDEKTLCDGFAVVNKVRKNTTLSYFEFATLAAFFIFTQRKLDFALLEVGLGGRLDAVNIIDADVTIISSIAMDHQDWLGDDLESIGREKSGILRYGVPLIYGDKEPIDAIIEKAEILKAPVYLAGREVNWRKDEKRSRWKWAGIRGNEQVEINNLRIPGLAISNVSLAIQALCVLELDLDQSKLNLVLKSLYLPGRCEQRIDKITGINVILDVAHNPASASFLAAKLIDEKLKADNLIRISAVIAVMADKDIGGIISALERAVDIWFAAQVNESRCLPAIELASRVRINNHNTINVCEKSIVTCYRRACTEAADYQGSRSNAQALVVVTGSFASVSAVRELTAELN